MEPQRRDRLRGVLSFRNRGNISNLGSSSADVDLPIRNALNVTGSSPVERETPTHGTVSVDNAAYIAAAEGTAPVLATTTGASAIASSKPSLGQETKSKKKLEFVPADQLGLRVVGQVPKDCKLE